MGGTAQCHWSKPGELIKARRIKPRALKRKKIQARLSGVKQRSCKQQMPGQAQRPTAPNSQRAAADGLGELGGSHSLAKRNKTPCETSPPLWQLQGRLSRALSPTGAQQSTLCCQGLGWRCKRFSCSCGQGAEPGRCSRECRSSLFQQEQKLQ